MGSMNQDNPPVIGRWTHSFEEDEDGVQVYRPTNSYPFPLSRKGRETIEFGTGGKIMIQKPGPDDRLNTKTYNWRALGMNRFAITETGQDHNRIIEILDAKSDILKVRTA